MSFGGQHHPPAALPLVEEAGWNWRGGSGLVRNSSPSQEFDPRNAEPVVSRYTD